MGNKKLGRDSRRFWQKIKAIHLPEPGRRIWSEQVRWYQLQHHIRLSFDSDRNQMAGRIWSASACAGRKSKPGTGRLLRMQAVKAGSVLMMVS